MKKKYIYIVLSGLAVAFLIGLAISSPVAELTGSQAPKNILDSVPNLQKLETSETDEYILLSTKEAPHVAKISGDTQEVTSILKPDRYPSLIIQKGVPVKWTIITDSNSLTYCDSELVLPFFDASKPLKSGENIIEFTLEDAGVVQYTCWMSMIGGAIAVVDDLNNYDANEIESQIEALPSVNGICESSGGLYQGRSGFCCCCGRR